MNVLATFQSLKLDKKKLDTSRFAPEKNPVSKLKQNFFNSKFKSSCSGVGVGVGVGVGGTRVVKYIGKV